MNTRNTTAGITAEIAKGWQPNNYLTNMSMAFFQKPEDYVAHSIFPVCPVQLSASYYYTFGKEDLARDNVQPKPAFGKVDPAVMGQDDNTYKCHVDQIILGIDQIAALNYQRSRAPGVNDPRRAKVRTATEQMLLHQDILFAKNFFCAGVWANELTGTANGSGSKESGWHSTEARPWGRKGTPCSPSGPGLQRPEKQPLREGEREIHRHHRKPRHRYAQRPGAAFRR